MILELSVGFFVLNEPVDLVKAVHRDPLASSFQRSSAAVAHLLLPPEDCEARPRGAVCVLLHLFPMEDPRIKDSLTTNHQ